MKRWSDIVVVGSSNTDLIIALERIPRPGETILGGEFFTAAGGKGANQAVAAARAGGAVSLIARLGHDDMAERAIGGLRREGIRLEHVSRDRRARSGAALIFVDRRGENAIAVAGGANARLSPAHLRKARETLLRAKVLLMQLETPLDTVLAAARFGTAGGSTVILNPAPARPLPAELLRATSILTPNETEAEQLAGIRIRGIASARVAATKLLRRGPKTVIITLGAKGALATTREGSHWVPGFTVEAVDTTAAGDVFNGALAVALTEDQALAAAVRFANAAAAISVTRRGAQPSAPARREIDAFLRAQAVTGHRRGRRTRLS